MFWNVGREVAGVLGDSAPECIGGCHVAGTIPDVQQLWREPFFENYGICPQYRSGIFRGFSGSGDCISSIDDIYVMEKPELPYQPLWMETPVNTYASVPSDLHGAICMV